MNKLRRSFSDRKPRNSVNSFKALMVVVICLCIICGKVLLDARNNAWQRVYENTVSLIAALEIETFRNIESFDLSLQAVADNLKIPELKQISPDLRQLVLFDRSANARHLHTILVLDETGKVSLFQNGEARGARSFQTRLF